jgi:hypothetical protein
LFDHVFTDVIAAVRDGLDGVHLEPQVVEERFHADVLGGDLTWQTSYSLPGEGTPPRVQADLTLEWTTWSQATYRSWRLGEHLVEPPRVGIELVLRVQRLRHPVEPAQVVAKLTEPPDGSGSFLLERGGPRLETAYDSDLAEPEHAIDVGWEGSCELDEDTLTDPARLDGRFADLGGWISAVLVRLGDLDLEFLPPEEEATP